ncbi:MAG: ATP-binding protein [Oscillospiraceae bacterium]|nr:ATP-binding protein [Oscillospiraceae bacterium]
MNEEHREELIAQADSIYPSRVNITIYDLDAFLQGGTLAVGAYLHLEDNTGKVLIATIENISASGTEAEDQGAGRVYRLAGQPLGMLVNGRFERGNTAIAFPVQKVELASHGEIRKIFEESVSDGDGFCFARLASDVDIRVPLDGNRFFNKHIAIVGSTGSGKSYTVTRILQTACQTRAGRNNAHVVIFDIHSEYRAAFPDANCLDISNLALPYWLMNSTELQEFFLDTEGNDHNQRNVFKEGVIMSKAKHFKGPEELRNKLTLDTPVFFEIEEVLNYAIEKNEEMVAGARGEKAGPLNGKLSNFIDRMETKLGDRRLAFLLGERARRQSFDAVLRQLMGYGTERSNVTILDVSGVPFEVLSITVSLVSRILFEYGYFYKRIRSASGAEIHNDVPVLLVYEEAHKYVPNTGSVKYRAARESIERIAKEGRKYGVSLMLASQRPSEISETIFSQCNNFVAMRLTNPTDQNFVKRLLPDSMGSVVDSLPALRTGECLLTGEAVLMPCIVKIQSTDCPPASNDIPYWSLWQEPWHELNIDAIREQWMDR